MKIIILLLGRVLMIPFVVLKHLLKGVEKIPVVNRLSAGVSLFFKNSELVQNIRNKISRFSGRSSLSLFGMKITAQIESDEFPDASPEEGIEESIQQIEELVVKSQRRLDSLLSHRREIESRLLQHQNKLQFLEEQKFEENKLYANRFKGYEKYLESDKKMLKERVESTAQQLRDINESVREQKLATNKLVFQLDELKTRKELMSSQFEMEKIKNIAFDELKEGESSLEKIEEKMIHQQVRSQFSEDPIQAFERELSAGMQEKREVNTKELLESVMEQRKAEEEEREKEKRKKQKMVLQSAFKEMKESKNKFHPSKYISKPQEPKKISKPQEQKDSRPQKEQQKGVAKKKPSKSVRIKEFFKKK